MGNKRNATRIRVEARWNAHTSESDKQRISYNLVNAFKRVCDKAGIVREAKERERYIKPSEKRRLARKLAKFNREHPELSDDYKGGK